MGGSFSACSQSSQKAHDVNHVPKFPAENSGRGLRPEGEKVTILFSVIDQNANLAPHIGIAADGPPHSVAVFDEFGHDRSTIDDIGSKKTCF